MTKAMMGGFGDDDDDAEEVDDSYNANDDFM